MSKAKFEIQSVIVLLFALVVILAVLFQMQRILPQPPKILQHMPKDRRIAVVDSAYVHLPFRFLVHAPASDWMIEPIPHDTVLSIIQEQSLYSQISWLVMMRPQSDNDSFRTRIGVLRVGDYPVMEYAVELLDDLLKQYEKDRRASVFQHVSPVSHTLPGSYFAVKFPQSDDLKVWIITCFKRGTLLYVIETRTTDRAYPNWRAVISSLPGRFVPISDYNFLSGK